MNTNLQNLFNSWKNKIKSKKGNWNNIKRYHTPLSYYPPSYRSINWHSLLFQFAESRP
jgi:hypothetical protein